MSSRALFSMKNDSGKPLASSVKVRYGSFRRMNTVDRRIGLQASPETYHTRSVGGAPNRTVERRQLPPVGGDDWEEVSESARKRQRPRHQSREDDQERRITSTPRRSMRLDDSPMLYEFYTTCLQEAQQTVCKLMSKAWIKVVEPKKQSMHPYTGSDAKAPSWWPKPAEENSKEGRVRHKEPDHLYKNGEFRSALHPPCPPALNWLQSVFFFSPISSDWPWSLFTRNIPPSKNSIST